MKKVMHPAILLRKVARDHAIMPNGMPILHYAISLEMQYENPGGLLNWQKLVNMGFSLNVVDGNGETAVSQLFKPSQHYHKAHDIIVWCCRNDYNRVHAKDNFRVKLFESLGKSLTLSGMTGFDTCFVIRLAHCLNNRYKLPFAETD